MRSGIAIPVLWTAKLNFPEEEEKKQNKKQLSLAEDEHLDISMAL